MEVGMDKKRIIFSIHSFVDVITNSSSELYVVDTEKIIGFAEELLQLFIENFGSNYNETSISKFSDSEYIEEYIIPKGVDKEHLYFINVDNNDLIISVLIEKYFETIQLEYKENY